MNTHVGAARVDLHLPGVSSLKGRRALLNRARANLRNELDVSVAEVGGQDQWQRASLAVATVASTPAGVDRVLDRVVAVVERDPAVIVVGVAMDVDVLDLDDLDPTAGLLATRGWAPPQED